ncbi:MAG TPA: TIGR00269 family protein, partial [Nitrososphaeraceae archaeon]
SMINYGDKIAVGVSGGKDSLSLLLVLNNIFERKKTNDIIAITIDEGIDGYRNESLRIVKDFCSKLNVKNEFFSYKELFGLNMDESMLLRPSEKMTSCSICGTFRRRAIDIAADYVGANVIATGHNLDDHLQSFMINIIAGDVNRIGWIYPEPIYYGKNELKKIKPFIEIYEREIVFYALQQNIPFQSEQCPYQDESIRSEIREFFNSLEETRSGVKYNTYNSLLKISKILKNYDSSVKNKCRICGHDSTRAVCSVCKNIKILKND